MNIKSEYYRSFEETLNHYGIDDAQIPGAFEQLQVPEDAMFSFIMFLLM